MYGMMVKIINVLNGEYTDTIIDNENTENNQCIKGISESKIKNIGYSDLFGKPHINQGETKKSGY